MKISVDKEGRAMINQLCDVALKAGGIQNLNGITQILASIVEDADTKVPLIPIKPEILPGLANENATVLKNQNLNERAK